MASKKGSSRRKLKKVKKIAATKPLTAKLVLFG